MNFDGHIHPIEHRYPRPENATRLLQKAQKTTHFLENSCNPTRPNTLQRRDYINLFTYRPNFENHRVYYAHRSHAGAQAPTLSAVLPFLCSISAMFFRSLHSIRATPLQTLVFSASFSPFTSVFHPWSSVATAFAFSLLRDHCVLGGPFSRSAAAKCSSNLPKSSSNLPKSSSRAQLEPFADEPIFATFSRQRTYESAPEKTTFDLSVSLGATAGSSSSAPLTALSPKEVVSAR